MNGADYQESPELSDLAVPSIEHDDPVLEDGPEESHQGLSDGVGYYVQDDTEEDGSDHAEEDDAEAEDDVE